MPALTSKHLEHYRVQYWASHELDARDNNQASPKVKLRAGMQAFLSAAEEFRSLTSVDPEEVLDNDIQPIFSKSNWDSHVDMGPFYDGASLAFKLASKFLTEEALLGWWVHLYYGEPAYNDEGEYCLKSSPDEIRPDAVKTVKEVLLQVAGNIKFTWLRRTDFPKGAGGFMAPNNYSLARFYHKATVGRQLPYEDSPPQPTIVLPINDYYDFIPGGRHHNCLSSLSPRCLNYQHLLATILLHELAHACTYLWGKSQLSEPYIVEDDIVPEAGVSWELSTFGDRAPVPTACYNGKGDGLLFRLWSLIDANSSRGAPLYMWLPAEYTAQFFLKKTWADSTKLLDKFNLLSPHLPARFFTAGVFDEGQIKMVNFLDGQDLNGTLKTRSIE